MSCVYTQLELRGLNLYPFESFRTRELKWIEVIYLSASLVRVNKFQIKIFYFNVNANLINVFNVNSFDSILHQDLLFSLFSIFFSIYINVI